MHIAVWRQSLDWVESNSLVFSGPSARTRSVNYAFIRLPLTDPTEFQEFAMILRASALQVAADDYCA
jgi:hypothetical protein